MNLNGNDKHKLIGVLETASSRAAESISMMVDHPVRTEIIDLNDDVADSIEKDFDREDIAVMVYSEIDLGEGGVTLFLLDEESSIRMANLLMMRDVDEDIGVMGDDDLSALKEVGNIVIGNLMGEIFDRLDLGMLHTPPEIIHDMLGAGIERMVGYSSLLDSDPIIANIKFKTEDLGIDAKYLLIPSDELNKKIINFLK